MAVYDIEKNIDRNKIEKAFEFFDINQDGFISLISSSLFKSLSPDLK